MQSVRGQTLLLWLWQNSQAHARHSPNTNYEQFTNEEAGKHELENLPEVNNYKVTEPTFALGGASSLHTGSVFMSIFRRSRMFPSGMKTIPSLDACPHVLRSLLSTQESKTGSWLYNLEAWSTFNFSELQRSPGSSVG